MADGASGTGVPGNTAGERLFARYAYAPNHLGYCGPADAAALAELAATGRCDADVTAIASRFSGVWPYLEVLAELAGIPDPLDERVVRAYWTGGGSLPGAVDTEAFGRKLLGRIGSQAGHYWSHLGEDLLPEAVPTHAFHVFGVYPWTRLLPSGDTGPAPEPAVHVLDSCRIRWGQVLSSADSGAGSAAVTIRTSHLTWDGTRLGLGDEAEEIVGPGFAADPRPGDWLAVHWDHVSDRLTPEEADSLRHWTSWQLARTNERLARA